MAAYCKVCGHYCKVQEEVIQWRDSFSGVRGHISCWRAITLNLTATVFWQKSKQFCMYRRVVTALRRYTVSVAEIYGKLRRDLQILQGKQF